MQETFKHVECLKEVKKHIVKRTDFGVKPGLESS